MTTTKRTYLRTVLHGLLAAVCLFCLFSCTEEYGSKKDPVDPTPNTPGDRQEVLLTLKNKLKPLTKATDSLSTKASTDLIATDAENEIASMDVFVFGSDEENGIYSFRELLYYRADGSSINQEWASSSMERNRSYIYSMPIERIIKYFNENGFDLNKSIAHSLIKKAAGMFDLLSETLQSAILEDYYLCMDESYYTILTGDVKNKSGKSTTKGYIWAALANHLKLVHFFYENGSRSRQVLTGYVKEDYQGAIQSDGLENYKIIEKDTYPNAIRLSCFQHCKRKFINIKGNKDAQKIVDTINLLYQKEDLIEPDWPSDRILEYRNKYAPPILDELEKQLLAIKEKKTTLSKSELSKAVNYTLGQYDSLRNYILNADYALDNNAIERLMRYISLSRKNSLFCGSHQGAKNAALIYSLACSCRLNNINTFDYFKDLLNKLIDINPNTDPAIIRNLLPDRYTR